MIVAVLSVLVTVAAAAQADLLVDDFEDGDTPGWRLVGDGGFLSDYSLAARPDGCRSAFCLCVTMASSRGWCGVSSPSWQGRLSRTPVAIALDARGEGKTAEICVDVHLTDGSRWWSIVPLPADGSWTHVRATADRFFAIENPHGAPAPDLAKVGSLWLSLRRSQDAAEGVATLCIDNVVLEGAEGFRPGALPTFGAAPVDLQGLRVCLADTSGLPALGQQTEAVAAATGALERAGAEVIRIPAGGMASVLEHKPAALVWEGPACRDVDWPAVRRFLATGGALVWWGAGEPFCRPVDGEGRGLAQTTAASRFLTQGVLEGLHPLEAEAPWRPTAEGRATWTGLPGELPPGKCRFLSTNDSIRLHTNWPWVDLVPLLTTTYTARNWIAADDTFTGSVVTLMRHRSGELGGARVALATLGNSLQSPLCPSHPLFAHTLTGLVRQTVEAVQTDASSAAAPGPGPAVHRAGFLSDPSGTLGVLDFGATGWREPDVVYAARRLGLNVLVAGIPWLVKPDTGGDVIDWEATDRLVEDAEALGCGIVFDPYCFGYGRFPWACESIGPQAGPACIHNPLFRQRFSRALSALAARYAARPSVVALFATPDTGTGAFYVDTTPLGAEAWSRYARGHGPAGELPQPPAKGELDISPERAGYVEFWWEAYRSFMGQVIEAVRREAPDMPLLLRGPYLDVAPSFRLAAEYGGVAPHCECIETSIDVESTLRGFAARYGVPISGENGWPKERGAPLGMAAATTLLGGYSTWLYSFGGPLWARPGLAEFERLRQVWPSLLGARYEAGDVGLLIPDATVWASEPPNFFSAEGRPHLEPFMERSGYGFHAVSAQWPLLDGLRVLVDDGRNDVLPRQSREQIVRWVRGGGTLVAFPHCGRHDAAGGEAGLAAELGLQPAPGSYDVGKGRVVYLPQVPDGGDERDLEAALREVCGPPPVEVVPAVCQALFRKAEISYLVLYHKSPDFVGAFFRESRLPAAIASLPDLHVRIQVPAGATAARELVSGQGLAIEAGEVELDLPATEYRVVEFRP